MSDERISEKSQQSIETLARCYQVLTESAKALCQVPLEALAKAEWERLAHIRSLCLDEITRLITPLLTRDLPKMKFEPLA